MTRLEIDFNAEESFATVYTTYAPSMTKLDKMCELFPEKYRCTERTKISASYTCPKDRIRFAAPVSEKKRAAGRNQMRNNSFFCRDFTAENDQTAADG